MSTKTTRAEKRTDHSGIRPDTIRLGTDADGSVHYYSTVRELIYAVDPTGGLDFVADVDQESAARGQLARDTLADYMTHVADARGWLERGYSSGSIADEFVAALEADR